MIEIQRDSRAEWLLEEHREGRARVERLGRRPMGFGLRAIIWALRVYVLFMLAVVLLNLFRTFHR